jgi:hypothetical protein
MFQLWHISLGLLRHQSPNLFQQHQVSSGDHCIKILSSKADSNRFILHINFVTNRNTDLSYSLHFLRAHSNKSDILSKKCVMGLETGGGGNNCTESWVPVALKRLYCLLISPPTVNLWLISTLQTEIRKIPKILEIKYENRTWSDHHPPDYSPGPFTMLSEKMRL